MPDTETLAPASTAALARAATLRTARRLLPPLACAYVLLLLDRAATAHVAPQLGAALGLTPFQVGLSNPILFLGILFFEVPGAVLATRTGARRFLSATVALWGLAAFATGLATGPAAFFAARALASLAQAAFLPVAVFLVASHVPATFRTRTLSWVVLSALLAALLEQPAVQLLAHTGPTLGLTGWRAVFVGLGLPCLPLAVLLHRRLPAPGAPSFLPPAEADTLAWLRAMEPRPLPARSPLDALLDPRILLLAGIGFGLSLSGFAASTLYASTVADPRAPRALVAALFVLATVGATLFWSRRVDTTGRLFDGLLITCGVATVGYAAAVFPGPVAARLFGLVAHGATLAAARTLAWSAASRLAFAGAGAGALALIDAASLLAAFIAPRILLGLVQQLGHPQLAFIALAATLAAATALAALLKLLARTS